MSFAKQLEKEKGRCFAIINKVKPYVKQFFQRADMFLLGVCLVSALFGTAMVFRAATGALNRYYIDRSTGSAYVTEQVPGIIDEEQRTGESLNVRDYMA